MKDKKVDVSSNLSDYLDRLFPLFTSLIWDFVVLRNVCFVFSASVSNASMQGSTDYRGPDIHIF